MGIAKIISFNDENTRVCASAARISTTPGDALHIFEAASDAEGNAKLIDKVLCSGHNSFIEHAVFTIAFSNVSVIVEQFLIEFRLASFTVKSRRYVDFGKMGYYTPPELENDARRVYQSHMDFLFSEYNYFVERGIPKEDARFILPYCFLSNFYCTVNARELTHILHEIYAGRGRQYKELYDLGNQILDQLHSSFPFGLGIIEKLREQFCVAESTTMFTQLSPAPVISSPACTLISYSDCTTDNQFVKCFFSNQERESGQQHNRLLELINASFIVKNVSLAGLTHIVRHRMQSIIVPPIWSIDPNRFILPSKVSDDNELRERYMQVYARNVQCIYELRGYGFKHEAYLALSGNTLDIVTSINAREMKLFFKLRCCTRAQWEVQGIAIEMLEKVRAKNSFLFSSFGPSCYVDGTCPEGRLTCGKLKKMF